MRALSRCEGIIPALEPAHAIFHAMQLAKELGAKDAAGADNIVLVNMCGRGDKDMATLAMLLKF